MVGRADHHGVERGGVVQQFAVVAVGLGAFGLLAASSQGDAAGPLDLPRVGIADGRQPHAAGEQIAQVGAALVAAAQQGNSQTIVGGRGVPAGGSAGLAPNRTIGLASAVAPKVEAAARKLRRVVRGVDATALAGFFRVIKLPFIGPLIYGGASESIPCCWSSAPID